MARILLIEDDLKLNKLLKSDLELEGYDVLTAADGLEGLEKARHQKPDVIILDVTLPRMSGYDVCRNLRKDKINTPILMLTAKGQEAEKVVGLNLGADEYVVKPVGTLELHARIKALLRRSGSADQRIERLVFDDLEIDFKRLTATCAGKPLNLSAREYQILELLARHEGGVVSRERFLQEIWGYEIMPTTRAVDNQILSLRQKLAGKKTKDYIHTVHGIGYRFVRP